MAYIDQHQDPRRRAVAIAGVAAVHAAIGAGLLVGLTVRGYIPAPDIYDPTTFTKPPEPTPPPPRPDQPKPTDRIVTAPLPPLDLYPDNPTDDVVVTDTLVTDTTGDVDTNRLVLPTPQPTVGPAFAPKGARPANRHNSGVTTDDYPRQPLMNGVEGRVGYSLVVSSNGRVSSCEVISSSGNRALDQATCKHISNRARFEAATDERGAKVVGTYTGTVHWQIPD